jgi:hypothetical protein
MSKMVSGKLRSFSFRQSSDANYLLITGWVVDKTDTMYPRNLVVSSEEARLVIFRTDHSTPT